MIVNLGKTREWFDGYVHSFDLSVAMIRMKYEHSYDVMRIGEHLVGAMNWSPEYARLGVASCLLHDTGRFSQYRDFGTYYDGASVDHGDRGYEVLQAEYSREAVDDEGLEALLQAVKWHNKKILPELESQVMPFCRLARDADKLDVFSLVQRRMDEGTIGSLLPRHEIDAPLSVPLLDEVEEHWSGSYKHASSLKDFLLIQLTWALDINFAPSLQMLEDSGVLSRIRNYLPQNDSRVKDILDRLFILIEEHKRAVA